MDELQKKLAEATVQLATAQAEATAQKSRADKAEGERDSARTELETLRSSRGDSESDALAKARARADKAEAARDDARAELERERADFAAAEKSITDRVRKRVDLENKAREIVGGEADAFSKMSDRDVKCSVIEKVDGASQKPDSSKSDEYVDARYDAACERAAKASTARLRTRGSFGETHTDALDETAARERMMQRNRNAWQGSKEGN